MAALRRQVLHGHRAWAPAWARLAAQPRGAPSRTAASSGGGRGVSPPVQTLEDAQEPGCGVRAPPCPLEKQSGPAAPGPGAPGEVAGALLDMGFSDEHIRGLLSVWPGAQPRQLLDVVSELILLGVNPEPACAALRSSPHLLALPAAHVKRRSSYLRRLGLGEGKLKTLLLCCPEVFTMHQRDIDSIVGVLKDKCLFTGQQVTRILHRCPYVLREDPGDLEYKFQVFPGARRQRGEECPFPASMSVWPCHPVKRDRCPLRVREGKAPGLRSRGAGAPTTYCVTWREWVQAPRDPDP
ncbi:transcription termination factor 4, mitochondrial isoform X3 [Vulpes lagopus]|uniref:transcription termination factor 4, mitochondrial isoform X3 n=1 Tax=Vulpes lagopus TaxID=494514 RepID=UPI001BC9B103|nr:transcription termination factor 4, mitochondrial isoform X3 [Vulpes lagopus]